MSKILRNIKILKKSVENLSGELWNCEIPWQISQLIPLAPVTQNITLITDSRRKSLESLSYKQQRALLSDLLEHIRASADAEYTSPTSIAAIALQLLSNEVDNRKEANVAKKIAYDGDFGNVVKSQISLEKSLFLLDALEIGKRKNSKLRQLHITNHAHLPAS